MISLQENRDAGMDTQEAQTEEDRHLNTMDLAPAVGGSDVVSVETSSGDRGNRNTAQTVSVATTIRPEDVPLPTDSESDSDGETPGAATPCVSAHGDTDSTSHCQPNVSMRHEDVPLPADSDSAEDVIVDTGGSVSQFQSSNRSSMTKAKSQKSKRKKKNRKKGVPMPPEVSSDPELKKYWAQRYRLFSKFDQGIKMDKGRNHYSYPC